MKKRFGRIVCLCLLTALLLVTAAAQEPEIGMAEDLKTIEYTGTVDLFQCGSLTGNYTKPGDVSLLDDTSIEKQIYDQLLAGLQARQASITVTRTDLAINQGNLDAFFALTLEIYETVLNDNPRLFYVSGGYNATGGGSSAGLYVTITPSYWAAVTDVQIAAFDQAVETAKNQVAGITDPLEILLILHDYLVIQNGYNWDVATTGTTDDNLVWSAYAALVQGDPVCQAYALAYKLLLNELGVECITVSSGTMNHMWNMVEIDGEWYHVDVTWDDPVPNTEGYCGHDYFLLSDDSISDHSGWDKTALPACTSKTYESGWIFNESLSSIYWWEESFYYVDNSYKLYEAESLNDIERTGYSISGAYHSGYGFAWVDGRLYFVPYTSNTQHTLKVCSLDTNTIEAAGTFNFTPTDVTEYTSANDWIGLRVNEAENTLEVVSSTRRETIYSVQLPEKRAGITSVKAERCENGVSVKFTLHSEGSGSLICAVYNADGRQLGVRYLNRPNTGEYSLDLTCDVGAAATVKIFLLDENSSPLCQETVISMGS